jgi:hypothetical protein
VQKSVENGGKTYGKESSKSSGIFFSSTGAIPSKQKRKKTLEKIVRNFASVFPVFGVRENACTRVEMQ